MSLLLKRAGRSSSRSGGVLDIRASVGTSTSPTSTGTKAVTGVGFQPKVVMPFANLQDAVGTATTILMNVGAATSPSVRACIAAYSQSGVTATNTRRRHDNAKLLSQVSATGTDFLVTDLASMDSDGFTYNYSVVDPLARILNHICLGGADLEVSLTQQQMNSTNAAQSFAHGLSGAPTGLLFLHGVQATAPPSTSGTAQFGISMWDGVNQYAAYVYSANGQSTTITGRSLTSGNVYSLFGGTKTVTRTMAISSVDATNVNVTYPVTTNSDQSYFFILAIRGAKCQTGTFNCNGSLSPLTIPCSGITPKLFLPVFVPSGVSSINTVINQAHLAIGASDGVNNVSCGFTDQDGVTTTNARRHQSSSTLAEYSASTGSLLFEAAATFSGQSVVITPTTYGLSSMGQGAYLIIGA